MKEEWHQQRCVDLRRRLREVEDHNEVVVVSIARTRRLIQRARLERALLLERLEQVSTAGRDPETEDTPPPSPLLTTQSGSATRGYKRASIPASTTPGTSTPANLKRRKASTSSSSSTKRLTPAEKAAIAADKAAAIMAAQAAASGPEGDAEEFGDDKATETPTRTSKRGPSLKITLSTRRASASTAAAPSDEASNASGGRVPWKPRKASELYRLDNPDGPAWEDLDAESQEPFRRSARSLRVRYAREMAALSPHSFTDTQRRAQERSKGVIRAMLDENLNEDDPAVDAHLAQLDESDDSEGEEEDEHESEVEENEETPHRNRRPSNGHRKQEETDEELSEHHEASEVYSATMSEAPTESASASEGEGEGEGEAASEL